MVDIKFDHYNAVAAMYIKAALGKDGKPTVWLQRSTFAPITSIFKVDAVYGDPGYLQQGWTDIPFDVPNLCVEDGPARAHVRIGWLRSGGRDPVDYLLELIGAPRNPQPQRRRLSELRRFVPNLSVRHRLAAPGPGSRRAKIRIGQSQTWCGAAAGASRGIAAF